MTTEINLEMLAYSLGPTGSGFYIARDVYPHGQLADLHEELTGPDPIWTPQADTEGEYSGHITQHFDVFAHKLSRGDQGMLERMPAFAGVAQFVRDQVVEPLSKIYPSLETWQADEITAQRYPGQTGKLSWHFDLPRHTGIIATLSAIGTGRLGVETSYEPHKSYRYGLDAGDLFVQRGPGLFDKAQLAGRRLRQRHAVQSTGVNGRTSITVRANNRPDEAIPGFSYHNWRP